MSFVQVRRDRLRCIECSYISADHAFSTQCIDLFAETPIGCYGLVELLQCLCKCDFSNSPVPRTTLPSESQSTTNSPARENATRHDASALPSTATIVALVLSRAALQPPCLMTSS
eukprot:6465461-Amphidinium_carterae.1